jgi:hypothetical protein
MLNQNDSSLFITPATPEKQSELVVTEMYSLSQKAKD